MSRVVVVDAKKQFFDFDGKTPLVDGGRPITFGQVVLNLVGMPHEGKVDRYGMYALGLEFYPAVTNEEEKGLVSLKINEQNLIKELVEKVVQNPLVYVPMLEYLKTGEGKYDESDKDD